MAINKRLEQATCAWFAWEIATLGSKKSLWVPRVEHGGVLNENNLSIVYRQKMYEIPRCTDEHRMG